MAPNFRRGAAAIAESKKKAESGGKNFRPFAPRIGWSDGDKKYLLFLTPIEESPTVELHEYVPIGEWKSKDGKKSGVRYGFYISQKDQAIGGDHDILEDEFGLKPRERTLGVAVELEPVMETVRGRKKPVGFEVKTETFTRKGEDDQEEEVTTPVIGVVSQASSNFFGYLASYDEEHAPITETPFEVKRDGGGTDTEYRFVPFADQPVDLAPVLENLDGILYLEEELDDLIAEVNEIDDELDAAIRVADAILEARLDELSDLERYERETAKVKTIPNNWGDDYKRNRPVAEDDEDDAEEEEAEEKPKPRSRSRSTSKAKPRSRSRSKKDEEPEEEPAEASADDDGDGDEDNSAKRTKFEEMRKKAGRKKATA